MKALNKVVRAALARIFIMRPWVLAIGLGTLVGVGMAIGPLAAQDAKATITIDNFTFAPAEMRVSAGTTVTWINHDDIPHSIVAKEKQFRSKALDTDDSYSFTFTTAGTFDYYCGLHPHMTGKVVVVP